MTTINDDEPSPVEYSERLKEVVSRMAQVRAAKIVRSDSHLQALGNLIRSIFVAEGFDGDDVLIKTQDEEEKKRRKKKGKNLTLPGYFRATKDWDLLVMEKDILVAAVEFKSMSTSAVKNVKNRVEEVLGSGTDLWAAHDAGYLGLIRPWLGYFLILEHSSEITAVPRIGKANFPVDETFRDLSYVERWQTACKRIVDRGVYDTACLIVSTENSAEPFYEPDHDLSFDRFASAIKSRAKNLNELRQQLGIPATSQEQRSS